MHERVFEYDGMFECLDCGAKWGVLPGNPTMPLECKMTELVGVRERLREIKKHVLEHYHRHSFCSSDVEDCLWVCTQLEGFLNEKTVKQLLDVQLEKALGNFLAVKQAIMGERERCAKIAEDWASNYPTSVFVPPSPHESKKAHNALVAIDQSIDKYSADMGRISGSEIAAAIRQPPEEVPNG